MPRKWIFCALAAVGFLLPFACLRATDAGPVNPKLISANNEFGFRLFKNITTKDSTKNVFISPFSIASALDMTYNGAATTTMTAMAKTLNLDGMSLDEVNQGNLALIQGMRNADPSVEIETANSLWAKEQYPFRSEFMSRSRNYYDAEISGLKGAPKTINEWVSRRTHGKIKEIVKQVDPLTVLFLVNATYFKGEWSTKFEKNRTRPAEFHLLAGETKTVQMMRRSGEYEYLDDSSFQAVRLPYGNGRMSMYVFLPNEKSSLTAFYQTLNPENWNSWMSGFHKAEIEVSFPRFKVEWDGNLNDPLKALGMRDAFSEGRHDFARMTPDPGVYVYQVLHKSFVKVDEEGTEAAAATSVHMRTKAIRLATRIVVDRPFFCAIRDDSTGSILFMGAVTNPEE